MQLLLINYSVPFSDMQGGDHTDQGNSSLVLEQRRHCFKDVKSEYICLNIYRVIKMYQDTLSTFIS